MKQIFLLGASSLYGVGGEKGGWGDLLKQHLHKKMYGADGVGETYEVFNFALSGATVQFVLETFPDQIKHYGRNNQMVDAVTIVSVGGNNAKATGTPHNYVSTVEEYVELMTKLITMLKQHSSQVVIVINGFVDETKTNPRVNPFTGNKSYFTNGRRLLFVSALKQLCVEQGVDCVETAVSVDDWNKNYLYNDGLHPNNAGHQLIFEAVRDALEL